MNGIENLITPYIHGLMVNGDDIMLFPGNKQVILNEEIEEWNDVHDCCNNQTDRITYTNHGDGYVIHRHGINGSVTDILISMQDIISGYDYLVNLPFDRFGNREWWSESIV